MPLRALRFARLRIGFGSESERLPDRSADRRGIARMPSSRLRASRERAAALPRIAVITASSW
jgi:hypothetical protein